MRIAVLITRMMQNACDINVSGRLVHAEEKYYSPLKAILKPNLCPCFLFVTKTNTFEILHIRKSTMNTSETGASGMTDGGLPRSA